MNKFFINKLYCQLINTRIPFTKNMSNPKPDFPTVIKTSISWKHPKNIGPNRKRNTNQSKITF